MAILLAQGTNYRDTYFQHADLTPIQGEPKNENIRVLINECKATTQNVYSNLGGGANGHLKLVLMTPKYAIIASRNQYVRPTFPDALLIPPNTTYVQA